MQKKLTVELTPKYGDGHASTHLLVSLKANSPPVQTDPHKLVEGVT